MFKDDCFLFEECCSNLKALLTTISEVTSIFATSNNAEELKHTWLEWHKAAGAVSRGNFTEYVAMYNEAAKLNGIYSFS